MSYARTDGGANAAALCPLARAMRVMAATILVFLALLVSATQAHGQEAAATDAVDIYRVGRLWAGTGEPMTDAVMIVAQGRIVAVGRSGSVQIPPRGREHDLSHRVVIPGIILAESSIGAPEDNDYAVTPHLRVIDGLNLFADHATWLSAGVTSVQVAPGAARLLPGQGAVVKLAGDGDARILRQQERVRLILNAAAWNPPTVYEPPIGAVSEDRPLEPTLPQLATSLADAVAGLRALFDAARGTERAGLNDTEQEIIDSLAEVLRGQVGLRVTARSAIEIRAAARLLHDYSLTAVLVDPVELTSLNVEVDRAWLDSFDGFVLMPPSRPGAIVNVPLPPRGEKPANQFWETARWLADQGRIDQISLGGVNESEAEDVLLLAGLLQRAGFSPAEILQMMTLNAARLLGVNNRLGALAPGLDADFVVLSGDPFQRGTQVVATYVNGRQVFTAERPAARTIAIRAAAVQTSHGPWSDAAIVVSGNSIAAVGPDVSIPMDADVFSFPGGVVIPGLIDLNAELGLGGALRDRIELNTTLSSLIVSEDDAVRLVRESGVTTVLVGSSRLPSPVMAIKLSDQPRVVKDPVALRFEVSGNLTTAEGTLRRALAQGKAYADQWAKYEADLAEYQRALAAYEAAQKAAATAPAESPEANQNAPGEPKNSNDTGDSSSPKQDAEKPDEEKKSEGPVKPTEPTKPRAVPNLEPYRQVFAGKLPVMVVAQQASAIEIAVRVAADEFQLPVVIAGADEADLALPALKRDDVAVALGPNLLAQRGERAVNVPQALATAGIPFGFQSNAATGSARLPTAIAFATYRGLGASDALRAIAPEPARFLQLGTIGRLEAGHDADLVVLSGPPFELGTEVLAVMIDGQWVYRREAKR